MSARPWLRSVRALAHANIAPALILGQALAWAASSVFSWRAALAVHALGVLDHLAIVWTNDLADEAGDRQHDAPTPFSGGSRVLVEGALSRAALVRARAVAVALFVLVGAAAALALGAPEIVPLVLAALALLWAYSGAPRFSDRAGGELLQGLGIGVVLPLLGAAGQGGLSGLSPAWLLPPLLCAMAGHWVTAVPDEDADRRAGKRTLPVRRGGLFARRAALALVWAGAGLGALVMPGVALARAVVLAATMASTLPAVIVHRDAGPAQRGRCLAYVVSMGGAISTAMVGWSVAAVMAR